MEKTWFYSTKPSQNDWWQCQQREKWEYQNKLFSSMTALVLTTTTFTLERKKIFCSFFTTTNELLLGFVDEKLTSFQYPLAFFASIPHYRSTPLREVSISMEETQRGPNQGGPNPMVYWFRIENGSRYSRGSNKSTVQIRSPVTQFCPKLIKVPWFLLLLCSTK